MTNQPIIFFDGVCNFCNASVNVILRSDKQAYFKFASLQSEYAKHFFEEHPLPKNIDSIILWEHDKLSFETTALLRVAGKLAFPWKLFVAGWIIPRFLRDPLYRFIAKRRYRWFGKRESCMIPTPDIAARFLDS